MLFAYFNSDDSSKRKLPLRQLVYSYMKNEIQEQGVKVNSDTDGTVYIPNFGYFLTKIPNQEMTLKKHNQVHILEVESKNIKHSFRHCSVVPYFDIEIIESNNVLLEKSFIDNDMNVIPDIKVKESTNRHSSHLCKAFDFIKRMCPDVANNILNSVQKVVIFNSEKINSFASFSFHGIAFLNVYSLDYNEVFFLDDISHQTGQIYFNMETFDKQSYFTINPSLTISFLIKGEVKNDERSLYVVFHALFTYTQILKTLHSYWIKKEGNKVQLNEVVGRICFYLRKFNNDIECFSIATNHTSTETILTKKGERTFNTFIKIFKSYKNKWRNYLEKVNLDEQPYNFDFEIFKSKNKYIELWF